MDGLAKDVKVTWFGNPLAPVLSKAINGLVNGAIACRSLVLLCPLDLLVLVQVSSSSCLPSVEVTAVEAAISLLKSGCRTLFKASMLFILCSSTNSNGVSPSPSKSL